MECIIESLKSSNSIEMLPVKYEFLARLCTYTKLFASQQRLFLNLKKMILYGLILSRLVQILTTYHNRINNNNFELYLLHSNYYIELKKLVIHSFELILHYIIDYKY